MNLGNVTENIAQAIVTYVTKLIGPETMKRLSRMDGRHGTPTAHGASLKI
jgi:hypothetical protein